MTRRSKGHSPKRADDKRQRRALSNVGGRVHTEGTPESCTLLATVMGEDMDADAARTHVHGFHAYPARMHPILARRCIELIAPRSGAVLDPFCGSGTVLVEARLAGRAGEGVDLNPLAVRLSRLKTTAASERELEVLTGVAARIAADAEQRRKTKRGATRRYPEDDVRLFDPHVLLELDGLRAGLEKLESGLTHDALWLVLSSILIKVSRQVGDTGEETVPKRIAAGFTIQLFQRKAQELARRMADFRAYLPRATPAARVVDGDARELRSVKDASVDLVVSSPPYAGTYDYVEHHRTRLRWLGLSATGMQHTEIGARRNLARMDHAQAVRSFRREMTNVFRTIQRVMNPRGRAVIVIADSIVGKEPVRADPLLRACAKEAGLQWLATASQDRPHFHGPSRHAFGQQARQEHVILFTR